MLYYKKPGLKCFGNKGKNKVPKEIHNPHIIYTFDTLHPRSLYKKKHAQVIKPNILSN